MVAVRTALLAGHQGLAEGQIDVHRPGQLALAAGGGAVAEGGEGVADPWIIHRRPGVEEVTHLDAEEAGLIGGLVSPPAT